MIVNPHLSGDSFYWQAGPTGVLLVHGYTATTSEVQPLARILNSEGYSVAGPLLPGHYTTPRELNQVKWQDWIGAVDQAFFQLSDRCQQVVVGGESAGGLIALYLAAQHPEIHAILLYSPALIFNYSSFDLLRLKALAPVIPWIHKKNPDENPLWQGYRVYPLKGVQQLIALQREVKPLLSQIQQPVLIVQGRKDPTIHPDVPETISAAVGSKIKEIYWMEQSKHCVAIDCELQAVAQITLQFLMKVRTA